MSFIAGAGITNIDLLYTGMPRIPDIGEEVYSEGFSLQLGGGIPATLINLGRLGVPAKIATALGDDIFSAFAKKEFEKYGVVPENLYAGSGFPLNVSSAIILENDRSFVTYGRGSLGCGSEACDRFYRLAHGSKITLMQPDGFLEVYRRLHAEGTVLVLDTGWDDKMSVEKYRDYIETADYYTPNRKEALKITGAADEDNALTMLSRYFEKPVIKLDRDGCVGIENGERIFVKSVESFKNVDSTGAGDAFLAGFCFGLFYGCSLRKCLLFGNITGGKCVTKAGALSAYVTKEELLDIAEKISEQDTRK
jgi:sugar/nucleoside kinase (ribokinase family)